MSDDDQAQPASSFFMSDAGLSMLKSAEAVSLQPYDDQTGKVSSTWVPGATIGYGHLITQNQWDTYKDGFEQSDADALLVHDLTPSVNAVQNCITAPITQNQFDAMVMLTFNIGVPSFTTSSVVKLVNNPNAPCSYPSLEAAWKAWDRSQGKVMPGLDNRRNCEWNVFSQGVYQKW